jgi:protein-L-isoaspartate(D-aspartate) O-methyltransferase
MDKEAQEKKWDQSRQAMLKQLRIYKIRDERILDTMGKVRRHACIPLEYRRRIDPYGDYPSSIGSGQTISQPYIVAYMTQAVDLEPGQKVLEIGTGSGYQSAVLAELGMEVYSVEIIPELAEHARRALAGEGYDNVHVLTGDGRKGWPEHSPYDAIIVTCAPEEIPDALVDQLKEGGRMILPLDTGPQQLIILRKKGGKISRQDDIMVRFVPMVKSNAERGTRSEE